MTAMGPHFHGSRSRCGLIPTVPWTLSSVWLKTFGIAPPDVGERGPELGGAQRPIRLPHQHRLVQPAPAQIAAELADLREVETKLLLARADHPNAPSRS